MRIIYPNLQKAIVFLFIRTTILLLHLLHVTKTHMEMMYVLVEIAMKIGARPILKLMIKVLSWMLVLRAMIVDHAQTKK